MGSKGATSSYDPQIGAATAAAAKTAQQAQDFSQNYYTNVITPMLQKQSAQADQSSSEQNQIFNTQFPLMQQQADMQTKYALPAQQRYYDQAAQFSSPQEMERQAAEAKSDSEQAIGAQDASRTRQMASLGISANSPAAVEAGQSATVANAANQAGAMNRARNTARQMGLNVSSQAAGFGNTGAANVGSYGAGAGNAATGAFGVANGALSGAISGASVPMQGYGTALQGYNNNADVWSTMGKASIAADAQNSLGAGFGKLLGAGLSAGKSSVFGGLMGF